MTGARGARKQMNKYNLWHTQQLTIQKPETEKAANKKTVENRNVRTKY